MKIALISDWFSEKMGYAENCLPKAIAALGHEVHLITSNVQPYFDLPTYSETYEPFIGPGTVACEVKELDGYTLHRLQYARLWRRLRIKGLVRKLLEIRPQIVQTFDAFSLTTLEAALARSLSGHKLFLESHIHASVFPASGSARKPWKWRVYSSTLGRATSRLSEKCYPVSTDAAQIAIEFLGIQESKVVVCSLGVDTDLFRPADSAAAQQARGQLRQRLGLAESDVVCIYTGRFSPDKNPLCLAQAIDRLAAQGQPFRGLFVGSGTRAEIEAIRACEGCVVHPFVPTRDLPPFYWAADIGVWPRQESTSQLDAAACGLPIVLSHRVQVRERIDGNGLMYQENDALSLAETLKTLADPSLRRRLGLAGAQKMQEYYSWNRIARQRVWDYSDELQSRGR